MRESRIALAALLLCLTTGGVEAQQASRGGGGQRPWWLTLGVGGTRDYLGFQLAVSGQTAEHQVLTGRVLRLEEFQLCIFGPCTTPPDRRFELGVLYGLQGGSGILHASLSAGLALVTGRGSARDPDLAGESFATVGVPIDVQFYLRPFRSLGIGASAVANLNGTESFTGFVLGVQVGWLRP